MLYIHDINVEAQNLLLQGIFNRRVPIRQSSDPRLWVLRTDDEEYLQRLRKYYFEEHRFAIEQKQSEKVEAWMAVSELEKTK